MRIKGSIRSLLKVARYRKNPKVAIIATAEFKDRDKVDDHTDQTLLSRSGSGRPLSG